VGFGDIVANPQSTLGQILVMIQVLLGYILLGALVTRFAVLFTAGGPSAKFAEKSFFDRTVERIRNLLKKIRGKISSVRKK
jgi:hypothetical protein